MRIEWHPAAIEDIRQIGVAEQKRIRKALQGLGSLDDARQRLVPYAGSLKGYWKLRVGDYRLVCQILTRNGQAVLIIHVAHRSTVYASRSLREIKTRQE